MNRSTTTKKMTATTLRNLLAAGIFLLFALGIGLFWLAYGQLQTHSKEVSAKNSEAVASNDSLSRLQATKRFLDSNTTLLDQVQLFTLNRELPQFQIRNDILHYAKLRNLSSASVDLSAGDADGAAASTPAATPGSSTPATPSVAATPASGNQLAATVTFEDEVEYVALLRFLHDIEHNLPKMTVEKVALSQGKNGDLVKVEPLVIKTYINQ